ncbi:hypothetical protein BDV12DRAFT_102436 [Aspergillus spectabilis]
MAPNAIGSLFRRQTASNFRQSINHFTQKRSWSARTIPSFYPTNSPELDQALSRFRDELFIPHSLTTEQQRMIYRNRHAAKLNENPITVSIGEDDEPYPLRPLGVSQLPSTKDAYKVLSLMHETKNWSNLAIFLTGLRNSGRSLETARWEWLVRKAGESNGLGPLLQCAQQANDTRFLLKEPALVKRLFFELHVLAQEDGFSGPAVEKAYGLATQFAHLMESDTHVVNDLEKDPRRSSFVIGTLLELSAARALNEPSPEKGGEVLNYARRFIASWEPPTTQTQQNWYQVDARLQDVVASYSGMNLASKVPEVTKANDVAAGLRKRVIEYGSFIGKLKKMAPKEILEKPTLGLRHARLVHKDLKS